MRAHARLLLAAYFSVLLVVPSTAFAWTACAYVDYWDSRSRRSNNTGSRVPLPAGQNRPAKGAEIHVYHMNGSCIDFRSNCFELNDNYLSGPHETSAYGGFCASLSGTQNLYFVSTMNNYVADIFDDAGQTPLIHSDVLAWSQSSSIYTLAWNLTCPDDSHNTVPGHCDDQTSVNDHFSANEPVANMLATIGEVQQYFGIMGWHGYNGRVEAFYPSGPTGQCGMGQCGLAWDRDQFCIGTFGCALSNHAVAHEVGHLIHSRALAAYGTGEYDYTDIDLGPSCSGNETAFQSSEKCSIAESWASFVGAATMWEPGSSNPWWSASAHPLEGLTTVGNASAEECAYQSSSPHRRQLNSLRWFWDLYDSTVVGETSSEDNATQSIATIVGEWENFIYGTDDREAGESGSHGRNAWDYEHQNGAAYTELLLNCLDSQEYN